MQLYNVNRIKLYLQRVINRDNYIFCTYYVNINKIVFLSDLS